MEAAGVPQEFRREQTKGQIALDCSIRSVGEKLLPGDVVITDAGYGVSEDLREGLEQRQLYYIAGVTPEMVVFTEEPRWAWPGPTSRGRLGAAPSGRGQPAPGEPEAPGRDDCRDSKVTWREGTKGKLSAKFAWVRVWPATVGPAADAPEPNRSGC